MNATQYYFFSKSFFRGKKILNFVIMEKDKAIGVFDSGIGGLSVLKQFIRFLPFEKYIYLGDTARVPYGNKSTDTVSHYARECTQFLMDKKVKLIVVACNTVSSVALDDVRNVANGVPVIGMITPAASAALRATQNNRIGVIGTRATINSNAYSDVLKSLSDNEKLKVISKSCPLFVPIVEEGWTFHPATRMIATEYLEPFKQEAIDTLVLGCTHYPLLSQLISEILPGVSLIDSGEHSSVSSIRILAELEALADEKNEFVRAPEIEFYVSDVPSTFFDLAKRFLGFPVEKPHRITIGKSY